MMNNYSRDNKFKGGMSMVVVSLLVVALLIIGVLVVYFLTMGGNGAMLTTSRMPTQQEAVFVDESNPPEPGPVSDSTHIEDLERELEATIVGEVEADLLQIETEAKTL